MNNKKLFEIKPMLLLLVLCLPLMPALSQDIENLIKSEKKLSVSGGLNVTQNFYDVSGISARKDPYSIFASGNVAFRFMQWSVPLSFLYSNQKFNYQYGNPFSFNRFSIQPSYKWIKIYAGYNNMSFSPYTISGHTFLGGGFELTPPKKWKLAGLYGQFQKAVPPTDRDGNNRTPSFKRMGYGLKYSHHISHEKEVFHEPDYDSKYDIDGDLKPDFQNPKAHTSIRNIEGDVEFILFGAKDDPSSLPVLADSIKIYPQENIATSFKISTRMLKTLSVNAEYAGSLITRNTLLGEEFFDKNVMSNTFGNFIHTNSSTFYYKAFKTSLANDFKMFTLGATYEYVDPDYTTLGAYYFNNDLENITGNLGTRLFKQKVNINVNVGTQRNNLQDNKMSATQRMSVSSNINYLVTENLSVAGSYSDFKTVTRVRSIFETINQVTPFENIDTLNFSQIAKNYNFNIAYQLPKRKDFNQSINGMISYQKTDDQQGEENAGLQQAKFYNGNLSYTIGVQPSSLNISFSLNYNLSDGSQSQSETWGPTLALSKPLLNKKIKNNISVSYNETSINNVQTNDVLNMRFGSSYIYREKHNISANMVFLNRKSMSVENRQPAFTETSFNLIYNYQF